MDEPTIPNPPPLLSLRLDESDEYVTVSVEAIPPTWRDLWAILRGRYRPALKVVRRLTVKGIDRELKAAWTTPKLMEQMYKDSPLLKLLEQQKDG